MLNLFRGFGILLAVSVTGCSITSGPHIVGSGKPASENRTVGSFRRISVSEGIQAAVEIKDKQSVTLEADDNILPLIETVVEGDTLVVQVKGSCSTKNPERARIAVKALAGLNVDSGASIRVVSVHCDNLDLTASSSGSISVKQLQANALSVAVSSSGKVTVGGKAERQRIEASSSGMYDGQRLASRTAEVQCSSSGSILVQASDELSGEVSTAGKVEYLGEPRVSVSATTAGTVSPAGSR